MAKLSLLDKINVLVKITSSSKIFIVVIISLLFLAYIFITTNRKNFKTSKVIYLSIYAIIMASLLFTYRTSLANMFDYFMNNLFIVIYFPNLAIYSAAIIISNIILWISLFSDKSNKLIKVINVFVYCIMTYILILILNIISIHKLDVFTQASIYGNTDALALIELSSVIFVAWMCFLIVYKIIRVFQKSHEKEPVPVKEVVKEKVIIKEDKPKVALPKSYRLVEAPYFVKAQNNNIKVEPNLKAYSDLFTIDDYKLLLNILSNHKHEEYTEDKKQLELEKIKLLEDEKQKQIEEELRKEKKLEEIKRQQLEQLAEIKKLEEIKKTKIMNMNQIKIEKEPIELLDITQNKTETEKSKFQQLQDLYRSVR